jgi:hypothetical protein
MRYQCHKPRARTMNDAARRLRAQKAYSTDPGYLERMALEEEARERVPPERVRLAKRQAEIANLVHAVVDARETA